MSTRLATLPFRFVKCRNAMRGARTGRLLTSSTGTPDSSSQLPLCIRFDFGTTITIENKRKATAGSTRFHRSQPINALNRLEALQGVSVLTARREFVLNHL